MLYMLYISLCVFILFIHLFIFSYKYIRIDSPSSPVCIDSNTSAITLEGSLDIIIKSIYFILLPLIPFELRNP